MKRSDWMRGLIDLESLYKSGMSITYCEFYLRSELHDMPTEYQNGWIDGMNYWRKFE